MNENEIDDLLDEVEDKGTVCVRRDGAEIQGPNAVVGCDHCDPETGQCIDPMLKSEWDLLVKLDLKPSAGRTYKTPSARSLPRHRQLSMPIPGQSGQPAYGTPKDSQRHETVHREDWGAPARESAQRHVGPEPQAREPDDPQREVLEGFETASDAHINMQRDLDARERGGTRHFEEPDREISILEAFEEAADEQAEAPHPYGYPDLAGRSGLTRHGWYEQANPYGDGVDAYGFPTDPYADPYAPPDVEDEGGSSEARR